MKLTCRISLTLSIGATMVLAITAAIPPTEKSFPNLMASSTFGHWKCILALGTEAVGIKAKSDLSLYRIYKIIFHSLQVFSRSQSLEKQGPRQSVAYGSDKVHEEAVPES